MNGNATEELVPLPLVCEDEFVVLVLDDEDGGSIPVLR